ncbi:hypothetical protein AAFF_G00375890 [Aldrovandia affinis]|uniref:Uncharacterized protein n=1 Tax=Aldrovandia affinis TaxID=143900 RepID=A0AAD7R4B8_9TELE|nr:hypothetical protein AAFF_G00375890 [Aldrovandia affinis]
MVALPTSADRETPAEWGDSEEPMDAGVAEWNKIPLRKRPLSGEHEEGRGHKEAPSIPLVKTVLKCSRGRGRGLTRFFAPLWSWNRLPRFPTRSAGRSPGWVLNPMRSIRGSAIIRERRRYRRRVPAPVSLDSALPVPDSATALLPPVSAPGAEDGGVAVATAAQAGRRLEVIRELPGCLSTSRSLILGGDFNLCLDGGEAGGRKLPTTLPEP